MTDPKQTSRSAIVASVIHEVVAVAKRKANRVSPYKKAFNQANNAALRVVNDPSDANIRTWAGKILAKSIGARALKLTPADINEIRTIALLLKDIDLYSAQQQSDFLIEAGKYSANNAQDKMQKLVSTLKTASDKEQLSTEQMSNNKIGNSLLLNQDKETSIPEFVNTNKGFR